MGKNDDVDSLQYQWRAKHSSATIIHGSGNWIGSSSSNITVNGSRGSFFYYVDKRRQVGGTRNVNGMQISHYNSKGIHLLMKLGESWWSIMSKIWSPQLKNDPLRRAVVSSSTPSTPSNSGIICVQNVVAKVEMVSYVKK